MTERNGPYCGGKLHGRDGTCTLPAGWGTDHLGVGRCRKHFGNAPNVVKAAREQELNAQAAAELARLGVASVTDPLAELGRLAGQAVAWKDRMAAKVNELAEIRYEDAKGAEQLRSEIALWERALDRCAAVLTAMARLGIDERLAAIRQRTADMLERALDTALEASGLGLDERSRAREVFRSKLIILPEPEPSAVRRAEFVDAEIRGLDRKVSDPHGRAQRQ